MRLKYIIVVLISIILVAGAITLINRPANSQDTTTSQSSSSRAPGKIAGCKFSSSLIGLCFDYDESAMGVVGETKNDGGEELDALEYYIATFAKSAVKIYSGPDLSGYTDPTSIPEGVKELEKLTSQDNKEFNIFLLSSFDGGTVTVTASYLNPNDDSKSLWFIADYAKDSPQIAATKAQLKAIVSSLKFEP